MHNSFFYSKFTILASIFLHAFVLCTCCPYILSCADPILAFLGCLLSVTVDTDASKEGCHGFTKNKVM